MEDLSQIESSQNRNAILQSTRPPPDEEPPPEPPKRPIGQRFLQLQVGDEVPDFRATPRP